MSTTMPYYLTNFLAKNEWNIHAQDDYALRWASENGHTEVVKILIEAGANIHADDDCALRWASENGHTEVVNLLIKNQNSEMTIEEFTLKLKLKKN